MMKFINVGFDNEKEFNVNTKSEIRNNYKRALTTMGVYQVRNLVNGKIFVGSNKNIPARINRHKFELKYGSENITELQEDYNKYGEDKFVYEIIDELKPKEDTEYNYTEDMKVLEELWIEKLQPFEEKGYNIRNNNL